MPRPLLLAVLLAVSLTGPANAIDPARAMSQYLRDRWGSEQGFPRGPVYAIGQSDDGYLWVGTQAGLVRFDGLKFRTIHDVPGLENGNSVLGLMSDGRGNLWIQMERDLLRYRNGVFDKPIGQMTSRISAISRSREGGPLVSLIGHGAALYSDGKMQTVAEAAELPRSPVLSIAETVDGSLWMGTRGAGLFRRSAGRMTPVLDGLPDPKVNCLYAASNGDVWVGTDSGIVRWDGSRLAPVGPPSLRHFQVLAIQPDRDGNIWVGTDSHGLLRVNQQAVAFLDSPGAVTAVFEDRERNLWIGSANRIERLRDSAFVSYSQAEGLPAVEASPILAGDDRLWFAPAGGGLYWMKEGRHGGVSVAGLDHDVVYSIAGDNGELWLGRQHGGLTRLRVENGSFAAQTFTKADGLAQDSVFSVYRSRDASLWAGTLSGGVSKLSGGKFTTYTVANGLLMNTVAAILEDSGGAMWFATPGGLNSLSKGGRWRAYTHREGLPSDNVYCLAQDSSGVLWIGTAAGLAFRSSGLIQTPADVPDVLREPVLGIAEDRLGELWIATSNHVLRVNRQRLFQGALQDNDLREYGTSDGLRSAEGVRRQPSVVRDPAGRIWFSLNRALSVVDPARLTRGLAPAIAQVQSLSANEKAIPLARSIHVPGGARRVTFGYTGLGLSAPDLVRFRYRLDGYDTGWSEPTEQHEAGYTNLAPHAYRFRLMASSPDGEWNGSETTLAFDVDPLFWQTWWFRAGSALACAGAIAAFFRLRMHRLASQLNLRFEERLAERTRIAQELHDTLLQGFMSASMQVHVANDSLPADSPVRPTLTRALLLMRQVIDEGRNTVRGLRASTNTSLDLETALALIERECSQLSEPEARTGFRLVVEGRRRALHPLLRDEVYRIGREALLNAFRHARAKNIEVELRYLPGQLRLLVRDDGGGIEPQILESGREGHWGLIGMRERAEQIGARLHVYSRPSGGTEVDLAVPGHIAFHGYSANRFKWAARRNGK